MFKSKLFCCTLIAVTVITGCTAIQNEKPVNNIASSTQIQTTQQQRDALILEEYKHDDKELTHDQENMTSLQGQEIHKQNNKIYSLDTAKTLIEFDIDKKSVRSIAKIDAERTYMEGDWIYYYNSTGIYKVNINETGITQLTSDHTQQLWVKNGKMYYTLQIGFDTINGTPQGDLYQIDLDGKNKKKLINHKIKHYFLIHNEWIYYVDFNDRSINKIKLDGSSQTLITPARAFIHAIIGDQLIYSEYIDGNKASSINLTTNEKRYYGLGFIRVGSDGQVFYLCSSDKNVIGWDVVNLIDEKTGEATKVGNMPDMGDVMVARNNMTLYRFGNSVYKKTENKDKGEVICAYGYVYGSYIYAIAFDDGEQSLSIMNTNGAEILKIASGQSNSVSKSTPTTPVKTAGSVKTNQTPQRTVTTAPIQSSKPKYPSDIKAMSVGSTGINVAIVQGFLKKKAGLYNYKVDGVFGAKTKEAVIAWQNTYNAQNPNNKITVDGIAGVETLGAMGFDTKNSSVLIDCKLYEEIFTYIVNDEQYRDPSWDAC